MAYTMTWHKAEPEERWGVGMKTCSYTMVAFCLALGIYVSGCGPMDNPSSATDTIQPTPTNTTGYYDPIYDPNEQLPGFSADLSQITQTVIANQNKGKLFAQLASKNGQLVLATGQVVQLVQLYKRDCPASIPNCDVTDAAALGVGTTALIASLDSLTGSVRNQGDRSTCVAFALSGAIEILAARKGTPTDVSEQNAYFLGKQVSNSWDSGGLFPDIVIDGLTKKGLGLVAEDKWPYNDVDKDCTAYDVAHPGFYCSATEAQGGGSDGKTQDPHATNGGFRIKTAHALYASLGRIKQALYRGYPVVLSINANSDFSIATLKQGVASWVFRISNCDGGVCGHAVLAVGYVDDANVEGGGYLLIKNSWGTSWGANGLVYATYTWLENSLLDANAIVAIE